MKLKFIIPVVGDFSAYSEELAAYLKPYLTAETELEFSSLQYGFETVETELAGMVNGSRCGKMRRILMASLWTVLMIRVCMHFERWG